MPHLLLRPSSTASTETADLNDKINEISLKKRVDFGFADDSPFSWWLSGGESKLPPEIERDNVEYKWKLTGMSEERRVHLVTQMRWRVGELGYCWYILGVKDNGDLEGISEEEYEATLTVLNDLVQRAKLSIKLVEAICIGTSRVISQVRIELQSTEKLSGLSIGEERVLFLGATGSGKTTLLSVLGDWGSRDDGRGKMRTRLLHHRHELLSGTTSSVTHQPLVFLPSHPTPLTLTDDSTLLQLERRREVLDEGRVVQLIDSAGKLRFNRTVFSVLTSAAQPARLAFIVLEAPSSSSSPSSPSSPSIPSQTIEIYRILEKLRVPVALLISKIDQSSTEAISHLLEDFSLHITHNKSLIIYNEGDNVDEGGLPVILTSAVNGDFLDSLAHFLYSLTTSPSLQEAAFVHARESASSALIVEQVAHPAEVGTVVYGQVAFGTIWVGDEMVLGPISRNSSNTSRSLSHSKAEFPEDSPVVRIRVKSIQRLKCPVNSATATQHVSLALQFLLPEPANTTINIRKGMAVIKLRPDSPLTVKPLKRIIAEVEQICGMTGQQFNGVLFVMGQRFPATLLLQQPRSKTFTEKSVCIVSFSEKRPATVFLFPSAPLIFIGNGRRETFVGKVIDYFA